MDLCAVQSSGAQQGVAGLAVHSSCSRANNREAPWNKSELLEQKVRSEIQAPSDDRVSVCLPSTMALSGALLTSKVVGRLWERGQMVC